MKLLCTHIHGHVAAGAMIQRGINEKETHFRSTSHSLCQSWNTFIINRKRVKFIILLSNSFPFIFVNWPLFSHFFPVRRKNMKWFNEKSKSDH